MDPNADLRVAGLDERLDGFLERLTASLGREDRRHWARAYVAGLLLDGQRKSVQPLAARLGATDNGQALHHFVTQSAWASEGLQEAMSREAAQRWPRAEAWILDETSFPKAGRHSVGVARQYCGALGKIANCQVAVSLHYAAQDASGQAGTAALGWRLLVPREWVDDPARRQKAGVPEALGYRSKNALALELIDEAIGRGLPRAPVLADGDYGDDFAWRAALRQRGVAYGVAVEPRANAWTEAPSGSPPPAAGRPPPQDLLAVPQSLAKIARALPARAWRQITWRQGTRGPMQSRFARVAIWASHGYTQRQHLKERAKEWLLIEWPRGQEAPCDYWLVHRGAAEKETPPTLRALVSLARGRWRIEQDYRELKEELGLDHFEGRSWRGWHHHVSLVCLAHLFLQSERSRPAPTPAAGGKKPGRPTAQSQAALRAPEPAPDAPPPARRAAAPVLPPMSLVPLAP